MLRGTKEPSGELKLKVHMARLAAAGAIVLGLGFPASTAAARPIDWPWKKKLPHKLTAECSIAPEEIEQGSAERLHASVKATDTRKHPVAIVWSGNGGVLSGTGEKVEVDASQMNPGVYSVMAVVQDAQRVSARCVANYRVLRPPNALTMSCRPEQDTVEVGSSVQLHATASDEMDNSLHYFWFTNGGKIEGQGAEVALDTTDLRPGVYTVTGRVEDSLGAATDCSLTVRVDPPPPPPAPPPPPPEPANIAQIVFARNQDALPASGQALLERVLMRLEDEPTARISVEGYADPNERQPQRLAAARAGAVLRYFLEHGIPQSRVATVVGLGGRRAAESRNRTLDIIWLPKGVLYQ